MSAVAGPSEQKQTLSRSAAAQRHQGAAFWLRADGLRFRVSGSLGESVRALALDPGKRMHDRVL